MAVQYKFWRSCEIILAISLFNGFGSQALGAESACFDLSRPLMAGIALPKPLDPSSNGVSGVKEVAKGDAYATYWAAVQGDTDRVISDIIKELLGHQTTSPARAELKIHEIPDPHFWARQEVEYRLHPFPLISVKWTEYWSFNLLKGDVTHPEKVLITYEKASGTHYIRHLCGQYELTSEPKGLNGKKTRILIYEEASAKSRTEQETLSGIAASLRQLQKSSR